MLKRVLFGVVLSLVLVAGLATVVWAQEGEPPATEEVAPGEGRPFGGGGPRMRGGWGAEGEDGERPPRPMTLLAEALGMTEEDLVAAFQEGQSLADIAAAQNVPLEDVVDVLIAPKAERLQRMVDEERLTQEEADARLALMTEHLLEWLEAGFEMPGGGPGRGGCGGPGGRRGPGRRGPGGRGPREGGEDAFGPFSPPSEAPATDA